KDFLFLVVVLCGQAEWTPEVSQLGTPARANAVGPNARAELEPGHRRRGAQDQRDEGLLLDADAARDAKVQAAQDQPLLRVTERTDHEAAVDVFVLIRIPIPIDLAVGRRQGIIDM